MIELGDVQPVQKSVMGFYGNAWKEVRVYKREWSCVTFSSFLSPKK